MLNMAIDILSLHLKVIISIETYLQTSNERYFFAVL